MSMCDSIIKYIEEATSNHGFACGHWGGNGAIEALEHKLCGLYGAKYALCVDSATNGLLYLLLATGLQRSEILTTSLSFGGTIAGALSLGCTLAFADVDNTLTLSPNSVQTILRFQPKTKAIIAVDYAGNPHHMQEIHRICGEYGLWHFVDAAQSMGAQYPCHDIADYCDAAVLSFGAGKTVFSGGEGGAIITNNMELYQRLLSACQHGHRQERDLGIGMSHDFALNGRIHPIASILANESFESGIMTVQSKRESYLNALASLRSFKSFLPIIKQENSSFYHCPIVVKDDKLFNLEFAESELRKNYYYSKAALTSLPEQLRRIGMSRRIRASDSFFLDGIIDKLYFLHMRTKL